MRVGGFCLAVQGFPRLIAPKATLIITKSDVDNHESTGVDVLGSKQSHHQLYQA